MKCYLILIYSFIAVCSLAQSEHDYNMVLGYKFVTDDPNVDDLYSLNFNNPPEDPFDTFEGAFNLWFGSTTMSDNEGQLIYYTNGCSVANAAHEIMENGDSLNVGPFYFERDCISEMYPSLSSYNAGTQSILSLPVPNTFDQYYVLHLLKELTPDGPNLGVAWITKLFCTKVDMTGDGGLGSVVQKNIEIIDDTLTLGLMTGVKHADNNRWWVLVSEFDSNRYYKVLLGENGVDTITRQTIGPVVPKGNSTTGMRVFNAAGNKLAFINSTAGLVLYDFDRATGILSNEQQIYLNNRDQSIGGVCFSSNNRYLYASSTDTLYQLDMETPDIATSKTIVAIYDGYTDPFTLNFYQMERGPDCKIYINSTAGAQNLHVIMSPDSPGLACDVRQHYLQLPFPRERNLLNAPNYRLGTPHPTCDSTINVVSSSTEPLAPPPITDGGVRVFPNPARERATVAFDLPFHGTLTLHDAHGRELLHQTAGGLAEYDLNLGALPGGVYFVRATTREGFVRTVRLVRMWE